MSDNYTALVLEDIRSQNQAILEAVSDMQRHVSTIPGLAAGLNSLGADIKTIRAAVSR